MRRILTGLFRAFGDRPAGFWFPCGGAVPCSGLKPEALGFFTMEKIHVRYGFCIMAAGAAAGFWFPCGATSRPRGGILRAAGGSPVTACGGRCAAGGRRHLQDLVPAVAVKGGGGTCRIRNMQFHLSVRCVLVIFGHLNRSCPHLGYESVVRLQESCSGGCRHNLRPRCVPGAGR